MDNQLISMLLIAIVAACVGSAIICVLALRLFPWFRSGERKAGDFRVDQSTGGFRIDTVKHKGKPLKLRVSSTELPLVGGVAMVLAVIAASIGAGFWFGLSDDQWMLLEILLLAMVGYGVVGFFDDARKVYKGVGISEIQKFVGVVIVSLAVAIALNRWVTSGGLSARFAYSPYAEMPFLGNLLVHAHFAWIIFFLLMTVTVASSTSLAVDFTDGMDGLVGGLLLSAALSFGAIMLSFHNAALWPAIITVLAVAGTALGYLPFNWPSSWRGRGQTSRKRRARLIMGDTGSLALGGVLALVAIISRLEFLLLVIGGVFLLEGLSALVSARILVRFFRSALFHERFRSKRGFAHTEFPLPFLATPMHHHYDLLGWDRRRLTYAAWLLGALLGVLGVASVIGAYTWERYLARFVAILILVAVWQSGTFTRSFFIGLIPTGTPGAPTEKKEEPRQLALFYGFPYRLFGWPLYRLRDITAVNEDALEAPTESLMLWQRMSVFDARALLGYYCYRADLPRDAVRVWEMIPRTNMLVRPDINEMMLEARNRLAMESEVDLSQPPAAARASNTARPAVSAEADAAPAQPLDTAPSPVIGSATRPDSLSPSSEPLLWSAANWAAATTPAGPAANVEASPDKREPPSAPELPLAESVTAKRARVESAPLTPQNAPVHLPESAYRNGLHGENGSAAIHTSRATPLLDADTNGQ